MAIRRKEDVWKGGRVTAAVTEPAAGLVAGRLLGTATGNVNVFDDGTFDVEVLVPTLVLGFTVPIPVRYGASMVSIEPRPASSGTVGDLTVNIVREPTAPVKRQSRWWLYVLIAAVAIFLITRINRKK